MVAIFSLLYFLTPFRMLKNCPIYSNDSRGRSMKHMIRFKPEDAFWLGVFQREDLSVRQADGCRMGRA